MPFFHFAFCGFPFSFLKSGMRCGLFMNCRERSSQEKKMFWNIYLMEWQETENGYTYAI